MHLFAGAGGGILADLLLGHQPVCAVEINEYCQQVLSARQKDRLLPWFPIFDDVQKFDGNPWRGVVDVVSGGFPCQDISVAGKGAGITGSRSGLWGHMARIIGEVRPRFVFVENSPALITRGLGVVLSDLAALGYDCKWTVLGAADVGAPHQRDRFWLVAHANSMREPQPQGCISDIGRRLGHGGEEVPDANGWGGLPWGLGRKQCTSSDEEDRERIRTLWAAEPDVGRMAHGVAARVDRLKATGNGQVPAVAVAAWKILTSSAA